MHGFYTYLEQNPGPRRDAFRDEPRFHEMSHGEPSSRCSRAFSTPRVLLPRRARGGQVLCATHSPVLASLPGARLLEVGDWDLRETAWEDLDLVWHWRRFLDTPEAYLRHLSAD